MRLRRIEAVRYGALAGTTLGDLADGLTVVHGPNEAGKSSYTSLVRHVLYRYPTGRDSEPGYGVGGDGRCARLVFEDAGGRWAIERTEGPHGGKVTVKALAGPDRADLLQEMTRGVSELAFRTVFGFGLGEMAAIEEQRGSGDSVIARLSAASAGLRVSPQEVRAAVDREAADLFKATGRKPPVNALISQVRAVRADLRRLRSEADLFMADRERLNGLEAELETARTLRDAARERSTGLAVAVERAEEKLAIISAQEETLRSLRRERRGIEEEIAGVVVDEPLLAAAPDLEAIIEEAAGHTSALRGLPDLDASRTKAETRAADATARTGLEPGALEKFEDIHKDAAEVEEAREDLQRLQLQVEARDDAARKAEGLRAEAEAAVARLTDQMRLAGDPEAALAERLAALDALESARAGERAPGRGTVDAPALVLLAAGLVAVVGGVVLRQWITVGIGAVLVIAGAALTLRSRSAGASASGEQGGAYLDLLGLEKDAGPLPFIEARPAQR